MTTDLTNKKNLAARTLKVGKNRLHFSEEHLNEIKEAITKQDIRELHAEGIIQIKPITGRRKIKKRKTKRGPGKIKRTINKRKQIYVKITRKLRRYLKDLKRAGEIENKLYIELRKKIRMREFKSKAHLKEYLASYKNAVIKKTEKIKPEKKEIKEKKTTKKTKTKEKEE
ncbi:MAG: 50S ribosomal protein L19e [Candidatus Pacearchaeota archaeon]|jgi:large subunit ribosomal protein L19e